MMNQPNYAQRNTFSFSHGDFTVEDYTGGPQLPGPGGSVIGFRLFTWKFTLKQPMLFFRKLSLTWVKQNNSGLLPFYHSVTRYPAFKIIDEAGRITDANELPRLGSFVGDYAPLPAGVYLIYVYLSNDMYTVAADERMELTYYTMNP